MSRKILPEDRIHPTAATIVAGKSSAIIDEIEGAMTKHDVVVVGMAQNPHVKKAKRALAAKGAPFHYLKYGSYLSDWRPRLEIKMWTGWPTFPMVFHKGVLLGGSAELEKYLASQG